ncbi:MAG TPA: hypothetical protein VGP36_19075 [Mycobacteriales bacterium]|jgi:hypothetical protein|nr:hypothetical protein [Mycobacteriales bacterium]
MRPQPDPAGSWFFHCDHVRRDPRQAPASPARIDGPPEIRLVPARVVL